jgi:hypothetical protein
MPFHCPSLSSQYHRPHHRYLASNQDEEELLVRGNHGNEEEIKHRASAGANDPRPPGDANCKFDLGTSVLVSLFRIYLRISCHPPYRFIPYATSMFDVFHRVIRPNPSTGTGQPRCCLPSETEERTFRKRGTLFGGIE